MKLASLVALSVSIGCIACNTAPRQKSDYAGLYYPASKTLGTDSSEVLHVTSVHKNDYEFKILGHTGAGTYKDGVVTGQLKSARAVAPFTFMKREDGTYEFRAFNSKVDLVKLETKR